jgi:hypothetical protein
MTGRAIENYAGNGTTTTIDIASLSAGAYVIEVTFNGVAGTVKRLIVKD